VQLQVITLGYEISQQSELRHQLTETQAQLKLELQTRKDLTKIERIAREELHMAAPDPRAIRVITLGDRAQ
jgi:cell division protein FtsL